MIAEKSNNRVMFRPTRDTSPLRVADGRRRGRRSSLIPVAGAGRILSTAKVCTARRLLAAGRYDTEEMLELVLDILIEDLRT